MQIGQSIQYSHSALRNAKVTVVMLLQQVENLDAFFVLARVVAKDGNVSTVALPVLKIKSTLVIIIFKFITITLTSCSYLNEIYGDTLYIYIYVPKC